MTNSDAIYATFIPSTGKLHLNVEQTDPNRSLKSVRVFDDGRVEIVAGDEEMRDTSQFRLAGTSVKPVTCSNLRRVGEDVTLSVSAVCQAPGQDPIVDHFLKDLHDGLHLRCGFCGVRVANIGSVQRVRPMPKSAEGFFCHGEDGDRVSGDVLPTECCFDGHSLLLNRVLLQPTRIEEGERCARCGLRLACREGERLMLQVEELSVEMEELDVDGDPLGLTHRSLVSDDESFLHLLVFGLVLNDDARAVIYTNEGTPVFLMWLVEHPTLVFRHAWPHDMGETTIPGVWSRKVLYRPLILQDSKENTWGNDITVASVHMDERRALEMLRILAESTVRLPESTRRVADFHVAVLTGEE